MADEHPFGDIAFIQTIRHPVSRKNKILVVQRSIPFVAHVSTPFPAHGRLEGCTPRPKRFFYGLVAGWPRGEIPRVKMMVDVPTGHPLDPSFLTFGFTGNNNLLAAPTLTFAVWVKQPIFSDPGGVIFKVLRKIGGWGIIIHSISSFQLVFTPGTLVTSPGFCM